MNIDMGLADPWLAQQQQAAPRGATLREFLTICFHDRTRISLAFLVPFVISVIVSFLPAPRYVADASLLVRLGREYVYKPEGSDAGATPMAYDSKETLRAEVEILNSLDIKETVLQQLGVATVYPWLAAQAPDAQRQTMAGLKEFQSRFEARLLKDSNVIQLSFTHRDAAISAQVLNKTIEAYLERRRAIFASGSYGNAQAKVASLSARLNEVEDKLEGFRRTHGIQSFTEQQTLLLGRKHSIELRLDDSALALAQSGGRSRSLQASLDFVGGEVTLSRETQRSEALESARKTMLELQLKERELSAKFSDTTPAVQDVRAAIARTQAYLAELAALPNQTVRSGRSPVRDNVEADWLKTRADQGQAGAGAAVLQQQRRVLDAQLKSFGANQRQLQGLERERRLLETSYEGAVRRLEEALVQDELDRGRKSNVSVVQAARAPFEAKSMQGLVLAVGTLLSLCCALVVAFFSALWRDTFLSPEQVQRSLGLPLLASVPHAAS